MTLHEERDLKKLLLQKGHKVLVEILVYLEHQECQEKMEKME